MSCLYGSRYASVLLTLALFGTADQTKGSLFFGLAPPESGISFSEAREVSDDGQVVVGRAFAHGVDRAFVWDAAIGLEMLDQTFVGLGVSGDGRVVVGQSVPQASGWHEPFRWTRSDGIQFLGAPTGVVLDSFTFASGASFDGSVIVGATKVEAKYKAFRWTEENGFQLLSSTVPPIDDDNAAAVSADGQTIVGYDSGRSEAFRWTLQEGKVLLGSLAPGASSSASNVSADGSVVVGDIAGSISFRWTAEDGMIPLDPAAIPGPNTIKPLFSYALATTRSGEAIVGSGNGTIAYVWTEAFGMESLQFVLTNRFGLGAELAGWRLDEARDISPDGRAIVGTGKNPAGQTQAWLVRLDRPIFVPEPCTGAMVIAATLCSCALRRRRRAL